MGGSFVRHTRRINDLAIVGPASIACEEGSGVFVILHSGYRPWVSHIDFN